MVLYLLSKIPPLFLVFWKFQNLLIQHQVINLIWYCKFFLSAVFIPECLKKWQKISLGWMGKNCQGSWWLGIDWVAQKAVRIEPLWVKQADCRSNVVLIIFKKMLSFYEQIPTGDFVKCNVTKRSRFSLSFFIRATFTHQHKYFRI